MSDYDFMSDYESDGLRLCPVCCDRDISRNQSCCSACTEQNWYDNHELDEDQATDIANELLAALNADSGYNYPFTQKTARATNRVNISNAR